MASLCSMTGYGEGRAESPKLRVAVTIRTVNHRFLDLAIRIPEVYRGFELGLAAQIKKRLMRGRVDVRYRVDLLEDPPFEVKVRHDVAEAYRTAVAGLGGDRGQEVPAHRLLALPEVVAVVAGEQQTGEVEEALFSASTEAALDEVVESRRREGKHLKEAIEQRLSELESFRSALAESAPQVKAALFEALNSRLEELVASKDLDPVRTTQEAALIADRADVQEELERLAAHLEAFRDKVRKGGPAGKKMDFLSQEVLRELNTLGAKCRNSDMLARVVEAKVSCEQLREQVQNAE